MRREPTHGPFLTASRVAATVLVLLAAQAGEGGAAVLPAGMRVAAIVSQDALPYDEALSGFRGHMERQGVAVQIDVYPLHGDPAGSDEALQSARRDGAQVLLTLGSLATQEAVRQVKDTPIVAGLVLKTEDLGGAANITGVVLEFPVEIELHWLQRMLPGLRNVGVLFNPAENQDRIDEATRAAKEMGLTLHARRVTTPKDLPGALDSLSNRADILWGVADQVVLTPQTVRPILLFSLHNRIPFVGLSATWVKAGALYALDRDYGDIGRQCGEMAVKILQGTAPRSIAPAPPRKVVYSVNMKTARILRLDIQAGLLQGALAVVD
jgi:putative tryptophan/tyrosine transport system substrate-binding protein